MIADLTHYLTDTARVFPTKIAIEETNGRSISYTQLDQVSDEVCRCLIEAGVRPGDRVGIWIRKSIDAVAAIFGVLKSGAAYVPVDPTAPVTRNSYIFTDCAVAIVIIEAPFRDLLTSSLSGHEVTPSIIEIERTGGGKFLRGMLTSHTASTGTPSKAGVSVQPDDLAFVLYTSGSTGKPKGVQLSHRNAASFIEWCAQTFGLRADDRFSSHAPFHFDLSVFDIYVCMKHGGTLVLIGEELGKQPAELAALISNYAITVWYSAPSILTLLSQFGSLRTHDYTALRLVLFAGEVFPIPHLRALSKLLPDSRYFNLYGPTETNVCTFYEVPIPISETRSEPVPIGKVCSHLEGVLVGTDGEIAHKGSDGELCIRGPSVTRGYWNLPELSEKCFVEVAGQAYYRTGDIVREDDDGNLIYLGRKDRMIKKRGFRVELGEIEVCLYRHPAIREAAVVALPDDSLGMRVHAHIVADGMTKLSLVEMKTFCSEHIPVYMIPDRFSFHASLPKTSTDKVDYQTLKTWSGG